MANWSWTRGTAAFTSFTPSRLLTSAERHRVLLQPPLRAAESKKLADIIVDGSTRLDSPGQVMTQFGHRIGEWHPLKPVLVAEAQFDHFTGGRFRQGPKFIRWRPDKKAGTCLMAQVQM